MPTVTVIVPVYNTEEYLSRCIDSILSQTFTDFELILINDGSTDNSGRICDNYAQKDSRVKVVHKENGGVSSARNKGLEVAQGEWITFVDSDDYVSETYLSDFPKNDENELEICGLISYNGQSFTSSQSHIRYVEKDVVNFYEDLFKYRANTSACAKLIKRSIIVENKIKFDVNIRLTEDTLFIVDLLYFINAIEIIPNTNYCYDAPSDYIQKYNITLEHINYNLQQLINCSKKLEKKYPFNINKIVEPIKYFQFSCFNYLINSADNGNKVLLLKQYRRYKLFNYRPKMTLKESIFLLYQIYFPRLANRNKI